MLKRQLRRLRFPDQIEQGFRESCELARRERQFRALLLSMALYESFLISDWTFIPDIFGLAATVRTMMLIPGLVLAWRIRQGMPHQQRECFIIFSMLCSGLTVIAFQFLTNSPYAEHYYVGLPLFIIFANTMLRLRFWYAVVGSLSLTMLAIVGVTVAGHLAPAIVQSFAMVMVSTSVFTLSALYALEYDERASYLMRLRERQLLSELAEANTKLHHMTLLDPLTGIANRRGFDEQLATCWAAAHAADQALSLIMIDVDFFKKYNDLYGHPAGDQCLKRVAAAITGALRHPPDQAVRFGGEEFAALLPNTPAVVALQIAERVRCAVFASDVIHNGSEVAAVITVSIGVATAFPASGSDTPANLLKAADLALYDAKVGGRNRVSATACATLSPELTQNRRATAR